MRRELNTEEFFAKVRLGEENIDGDDENTVDLYELIFSEGELVARQDWDSGGAGGGAGNLSVYFFRGYYIADNEIEMLGPFDALANAIDAIGLKNKTNATTQVWIKRA